VIAANLPSSFNQIHRLKSQPGWTWEHLFNEVSLIYAPGLDEKTLYNHYRHPHHKGRQHVINIINQLHQKYFPDPFPDDINGIMRLYNNLHDCQNHKNQDEDIHSLEVFAHSQAEREAEEDHLRRCRWLWLTANIAFDRIAYFRDNGKQQALTSSRNTAASLYEDAILELETYNDNHQDLKIEERVIFKLRQNALACFLNAVPQIKRNEDTDILTYLKQSNFIEHSKAMLSLEPFHWVIARNGLRFSSLLRDSENCRFFFTKLTKASKYFADLTYKPLGYLPIAEGQDFAWAMDHALTREYLKQIQS